MSGKIRLIIFDLDGTLIDSMGSFADIAGDLLRRFYGLSFEEGRKRYLETSGVPFFQQMQILYPHNEKNKTTIELFERLKISSFVKERISEKTLETLHTLRDREIRTAISSNNFHELVREFVHRENPPVDLALGFRSDFSKGTPHFEYIRDYFHIPFENMVFVGDSLCDAQQATEHNIRFVAKIGTFTEHDFKSFEHDSQYVASIYEVYEILNILEA